jgi:iron complex outermembrane receptor protein
VKKRWALTACAALGWPLALYAEEAAQPEGEEIVVTGSYIKGTPEDAALPVDVIDSHELEVRGNPSPLDLIRSMPYVTSIMGETNQFGANQGTIGTGSINLRGLGGIRTLTLMNGRRTTFTPAEGPTGVDTMLLPFAAFSRVEVLKDGAAATYGSDAIAGVVNFITRKDLNGLELKGEYRSIDGSDGDYEGSINWGFVGDTGNVLLSYARQNRGELGSTDRDWAFPDYLDNPTGWSNLSSPGTFIPRGSAVTPTAPLGQNLVATRPLGVIDRGCTAVGGYQDQTSCRFSYIPGDNLVELTERQQLYGEINAEIAPSVNLHLEALYAENNQPDYRTSSGYAPLTGPGGPGVGQFFIQSTGPTQFANNPGALTALQQAAADPTTGFTAAQIPLVQRMQPLLWRPFGWFGSQVTDDNGGRLIRNHFDIYRYGVDVNGELEVPFINRLGWDFAMTYSDSTFQRAGQDTAIVKLQNALNGLGGKNCNGIPFGSPGSTCQFFNPFSNGYERNPSLNLNNPFFVPANENDKDLLRWMNDGWDVIQDQQLFVVDAVLNGEVPAFELPGGAIGWAAGVQYRKTTYETRPDNPLIDQRVNPCPTPGVTTCTLKTGPFIFLGQFTPQQLDDTVNAVFGELAIPLFESVDIQFAIRYEDYGGLTGDTTDPKISVRWQALEWLALRGSAGSTFRGPTPVNKALQATGLQPLPAIGGVYKAIDISGNPDLSPEKADTYSLGFIVELGGFRGIVDYWNYDFEDQITTVPFFAVSNAVLNGPGTGAQFANCGHPLRDLVVFDNNNTCTQGVTTAAQAQRIIAGVINGSPAQTAGYDISLAYDFGEVLGGTLEIGTDATFVDKYDQEAFVLGGVTIFDDYDAVGFGNYERFPGPISEWRALGHINYGWGPLNVRYEVRYVDGLYDERPYVPVVDAAGVRKSVTFGKTVDSFTAHNLYVTWDAPWETTVSFAVTNIADEDPPEVRHQLSYDPYIGDPIGRVWELGIKKTFGGD